MHIVSREKKSNSCLTMLKKGVVEDIEGLFALVPEAQIDEYSLLGKFDRSKQGQHAGTEIT